MQALAQSVPLEHLEDTIPYSSLGLEVIQDICTWRLPLKRAAWLVQICTKRTNPG